MRIVLLLLLLAGAWSSAAEEALLRPEQAFVISSRAEGNNIIVRWDIADGYYLYRSKFRFDSADPRITLGEPDLPPAEIKKDPFFGDVEIYRNAVEAVIPVHYEGPNRPEMIELSARIQGCADVGICFPPHTQTLLVALDRNADRPPPVPPSAAEEMEQALEQFAGSPVAETEEAPAASPAPEAPQTLDRLADLNDALGLNAGEEEILPPEQAYRVTPEVINGNRLRLHFQVAEGTYLYQDKIEVAVKGEGVAVSRLELPKPKIKPDTIRPDGTLGDVALYDDDFQVGVPLAREATGPQEVTLEVRYQGCAERGICYPPQRKTFTLVLPAAGVAAAPPQQGTAATTAPPATEEALSEQDRIAGLLQSGSVWLVVLSFFGVGLLLAFTPCVFPMIPILSGIIAGQGEGITTRRALFLSTVFVLAMAITYTLAGVLAGLFGANLQTAFQNPWILSLFALLFVALALSMFGFYDLQLPARWQTRLSELSNRQQGGQATGVAVMGLLSALIVGPCVAPPLAGALIFIGQTGDWQLGGLALFAMSLGMGAPLLVIGTSAGKLLPKAGRWMDAVKAVFGVLMLGLAITMLERFLPEVVTMTLWGVLLMVSAVYMGALEPLPAEAGGWRRLWKGLGVVLLVYGALFLVGVAAGGKDNLQPLRGLMPTVAGGGPSAGHVTFKRIKTLEDLEREVAAASAAGRPVMLDFYADWCVYCKTLEKNVFPDPKVRAQLERFVLLQADVTAQDEADKALQQRFQVPAPPAMIFWNGRGEELRSKRLMGNVTAQALATHLERIR